MKSIPILIVAAVLVTGEPEAMAQARRQPARRNQNTSVVAGIRRHSEHSEFEELPFERRDMSYGIAWEVHDANGYWQLGVNYTPDVGHATNDVKYVATPFINLMLKDKGWLAGVGVLSSYIVTEEDKDWTSLYWQMMLGFSVPVGNFEIDVMGYYPFKSWSKLRDFSTRDLEFGGLFRYRF